ncbi:MAG: hypothetical protein QFX33_05070 [Candidatus Nezhaarchaeota archaeon]|nr:hypothetical protein [Candidatus Nezhaarchaeota archaeon]
MGEYKARDGKLVKVVISLEESRISGIIITGDFFLEPPEALEAICKKLEGVNVYNLGIALKNVEEYINSNGVLLFGVDVEGLGRAIARALDHESDAL